MMGDAATLPTLSRAIMEGVIMVKVVVDVQKMLNLLEQHGIKVTIQDQSPERIENMNNILSASLRKWMRLDEESVPENPIEISFDDYVKQYGYEEAINAVIVRKMVEHGLVKDHATFWVYQQYIKLCEQNKVLPMFNKLYFSKVITQAFHYTIQDLKRNGTKYRVFRES